MEKTNVVGKVVYPLEQIFRQLEDRAAQNGTFIRLYYRELVLPIAMAVSGLPEAEIDAQMEMASFVFDDTDTESGCSIDQIRFILRSVVEDSEAFLHVQVVHKTRTTDDEDHPDTSIELSYDISPSDMVVGLHHGTFEGTVDEVGEWVLSVCKQLEGNDDIARYFLPSITADEFMSWFVSLPKKHFFVEMRRNSRDVFVRNLNTARRYITNPDDFKDRNLLCIFESTGTMLTLFKCDDRYCITFYLDWRYPAQLHVRVGDRLSIDLPYSDELASHLLDIIDRVPEEYDGDVYSVITTVAERNSMLTEYLKSVLQDPTAVVIKAAMGDSYQVIDTRHNLDVLLVESGDHCTYKFEYYIPVYRAYTGNDVFLGTVRSDEIYRILSNLGSVYKKYNDNLYYSNISTFYKHIANINEDMGHVVFVHGEKDPHICDDDRPLYLSGGRGYLEHPYER